MATAICKLMYNITIHMTGYGVRILLTNGCEIIGGKIVATNLPLRLSTTISYIYIYKYAIHTCTHTYIHRYATLESLTIFVVWGKYT